jgi:hypothetical protein
VRLLFSVLMLVVLSPVAASSDLIGQASVIDGDTLEITVASCTVNDIDLANWLVR